MSRDFIRRAAQVSRDDNVENFQLVRCCPKPRVLNIQLQLCNKIIRILDNNVETCNEIYPR